MALTKCTLGCLIEQSTDTNTDLLYGPDAVRGMTITKQIIPTKADVSSTDLSKFLVVSPEEFVYNPRTHGKKIGFGYNDSPETFLISWNNIAFRVKPERRSEVLPEYLFLHFNRSEWDREACYRSWGSSTEVFSWDALCEMEIDLPPVGIQQKYVDVYNAVLANQRGYERGLDDLKLACDAYVDQLRNNLKPQRIGDYIELSDERNDELTYGIEDVRGISIEKKFISTKADMEGVSLRPYYLVKPNYFAYVPVTSRNGEKISLAFNDSKDTYICSSSYIVFSVKNQEKLYPGYLRILLSRDEFNRYSRFNSWGSARETFDWTEMCDVEVPLPDIAVQKAISEMFDVYIERKEINERLKEQIKNLCPILIKGSTEEALA